MMMFFKTRDAQRAFKGNAKKVDNGSQAGAQRWAIVIQPTKSPDNS